MLRDLAFRLRALFRRQAVEDELDAELRFHLERQAEAYVDAGWSREEAVRRARRDLGGLGDLGDLAGGGGIDRVKEACRGARGTLALETLLQDLRLGLRILRRGPGFTLVAVTTLALGIGANAAIFSAVDAVLLRPLPYGDPHALVWLYCARVDRARAPFSIADLEDYASQGHMLAATAGWTTWGANLTGEGRPQRLQGIKVTGNFFATLGVLPWQGRLLAPADDSPAAPAAVVLTYGAWGRLFGAEHAAVGRAILLNGRRYAVIGVLPPGFYFPQRDAEIAAALMPAADPRRADRGDRFLRGVGRLRPGTAAAAAAADLTAVARRLRRLYPATNEKNVGVRAMPLQEELVGSLRTALLVLTGAVGMVLLLACVNLGHLMYARFSVRRHELAVRRALGATAGRLVRQLLVEGCLLAAAGTLLGIAFARWCIPVLVHASPAQVPDAGGIGLDLHVLAFVAAIGLLAVLAFGCWPALLASRQQPGAAIRGSGPALGAGAAGARLRQLLIAAEATLAVLLLSGAGLFAKSFVRLAEVAPGFDARGVLAMRLSLPPERYLAPAAVAAFERRLTERLGALPGVTAVGINSSLPLSGTWAADDFTIAGRPPLTAAETPSAQYRVVSPRYFAAMGIPVLAGRAFDGGDLPETRPVAIVNRTLAARFWPGASPLGSRLALGGYAPAGGAAEVVGVVGDVKHLELDAEPTLDVYVPLRQASPGYLPYLVNGMWVVVRSAGDPGALAAPVRDAVREVDADVATSRMAPLAGYLADALALRRFNAWLAGLFGVAALALAAIGIYGVIACSVAGRRREIGVRIAFGARPAGILSLVVVAAMAPAAAGVAAGLLAALALARFASRLLFGVGAHDAATLAEAASFLLVVALLACWLPARRAAKVDPMTALRGD